MTNTPKTKMQEFDLHWLDGTVRRVEGHDIADAINRAGYGREALRALDYYSPVEERAEKDVLTRIKEMAFEDPSQPIINVLYLIHTHEESAQRTD